MFSVFFEDGTAISEKDSTWMEVPKNKRITALQVLLPQGGFLTVSGYERYFFMNEAVVVPGANYGGVVAKVFGGVQRLERIMRCPSCKNKNSLGDSNGSQNELRMVCSLCNQTTPCNLFLVHEFRVERSGNITTRRYSFNCFRYSNEILRPESLVKGFPVRNNESTQQDSAVN